MHFEFNLGAIDQFKYYYELDFSGFDSSQTKIHYSQEIQWYKAVFRKWK